MNCRVEISKLEPKLSSKRLQTSSLTRNLCTSKNRIMIYGNWDIVDHKRGKGSSPDFLELTPSHEPAPSDPKLRRAQNVQKLDTVTIHLNLFINWSR